MNEKELLQQFFAGNARYQYLDVIGRGGMSVVFRGIDLELDEVIAIKVLAQSESIAEPEQLIRFKREINLNRKIKHPNVARLYEYGTRNGLSYITMEFIPGTDLKKILEDNTMGLPVKRALTILRQICLGTQAAHSHGIIHRDLKSSNVVIGPEDTVAILDFGLARAKYNPNLTMDTVMLGTPHYMAPEQAVGTPIDHRADIYSIGVIAFEVLCGEVPFTGDNPIAVAYKHVTDRIPDTLEYFPEMRPRLKNAVYKALAKNPEVRFATAAQFEAELAAVQREYTSGALRAVKDPEPPKPRGPEKPPASTAPKTDSRPVAVLLPPRRQAPGTRHSRVLLVEADSERRRLRRSQLVEAGYTVLDASDGFEALEMLPRVQPGLVVIDVRVPGMSGFDVTRAIRSREDLSVLPVILLVPDLDRQAYAYGIQCGANDLLDAAGSEEEFTQAASGRLKPDALEMPSGSSRADSNGDSEGSSR